MCSGRVRRSPQLSVNKHGGWRELQHADGNAAALGIVAVTMDRSSRSGSEPLRPDGLRGEDPCEVVVSDARRSSQHAGAASCGQRWSVAVTVKVSQKAHCAFQQRVAAAFDAVIMLSLVGFTRFPHASPMDRSCACRRPR